MESENEDESSLFTALIMRSCHVGRLYELYLPANSTSSCYHFIRCLVNSLRVASQKITETFDGDCKPNTVVGQWGGRVYPDPLSVSGRYNHIIYNTKRDGDTVILRILTE